MARKKKPILDGDAIAQAISKDLPGWNLARQSNVADEAAAETAANAKPGTTIENLRRKFLGVDADSDSTSASDSAEDYGEPAKKRSTVKVEPKSGGPAKVADVEGGKVKIVQG